ncbi:hypothetical protein Prudu_1107S000100 [Prunus dulcis]|uniref:Uncharacterized protein n=1 Tax=Prunus dulcis TaxID=3755 RepID=A0A5H2XNX2_PRUDU|nr:hypothetical protein Prudu_1107S000100 [Prunus dulcis]
MIRLAKIGNSRLRDMFPLSNPVRNPSIKPEGTASIVDLQIELTAASPQRRKVATSGVVKWIQLEFWYATMEVGLRRITLRVMKVGRLKA